MMKKKIARNIKALTNLQVNIFRLFTKKLCQKPVFVLRQ
jgi:hypothetical protein